MMMNDGQQEIQRFVPDFKVVPYWGTPAQRKILCSSLILSVGATVVAATRWATLDNNFSFLFAAVLVGFEFAQLCARASFVWDGIRSLQLARQRA
jgi:hypothetical protein